MTTKLTHRKATFSDLYKIIKLLFEDELGQTREDSSPEINSRYIDTFHKIDADPNQYLMVVEDDGEIIGTCHLSIMLSLTFKGAPRMQIEAVRIDEKYRGKKFGEWMMSAAIDYGRSRGVSIVQLMTNKERVLAYKFYERIGFEATHEGMKLYL